MQTNDDTRKRARAAPKSQTTKRKTAALKLTPAAPKRKAAAPKSELSAPNSAPASPNPELAPPSADGDTPTTAPAAPAAPAAPPAADAAQNDAEDQVVAAWLGSYAAKDKQRKSEAVASWEAYRKLSTELEREPDSARGAAILALAHVDTVLEKAIKRLLVEAPAVTDLFDGQRALATSSAKIDMAYALGIISGETRRDLHVIRKIRNHFAHELVSGDFDAEPARGLMRKLSGFRFFENVSMAGTARFKALSAMVMGGLDAECEVASLRERPTSPRDSFPPR